MSNRTPPIVVDSQTTDVIALSAELSALNQLRVECFLNVRRALIHDFDDESQGLRRDQNDTILEQLYNALICPLESHLEGKHRIIFVPFGSLHHLPFHLLRKDDSYLIEDYEVLLLPAASMLLRQPPVRSGALILGHSREGKLPLALNEARQIGDILDGEVRIEQRADTAFLQDAPRQILHIAAHGEYDTRYPEVSHLDLEGRGLYPDDVLQNDFSYELITLSGCETGRSKVAAQDELIGLRGAFLYAGASSLLVSLWQVHDQFALQIMTDFYSALMAGESKAASVRTAQLKLYHEQPDLHSAYWGAFQLIGHAGSLSPRA